MEDNQLALDTLSDMNNRTQENSNIKIEKIDSRTDNEELSKQDEAKGEDISSSQAIIQSNLNSEVKNKKELIQLPKEPIQQTSTSTVGVMEETKETKESITKIKKNNTHQEVALNEPKSNDSNINYNQVNITNAILATTINDIKTNENVNESIAQNLDQNQEKEIIELESDIIEENEAKPNPKENKLKLINNKPKFYKSNITTSPKKIDPLKKKPTRNNTSTKSEKCNLSAMNSLQSSPRIQRTKNRLMSSKANEKANPHKQLNSTTIQIENRPEIRSSAKIPKKELFNTTYQRFQEKQKEKGDKIENLRKKMEERETNCLTPIPKINKCKMTPNDSDFLSRQRAYEQKMKDKKDKLATEAKSKIDKELNIAAKQSKVKKEVVKERLLHFKEWEEKKKQKIVQMKTEIEKKAIDEINNNKLHKGAKCNINDSCRRLYQDEVKKRQHNKQILQTMMKPAFKPTINTSIKKIVKEKELNSDKSKFKGLDRRSERGSDIKREANTSMEKFTNKEKELSIDRMTIQAYESVTILEEDSKILTTNFLTERNTNAIREKLFRNKQKLVMK